MATMFGCRITEGYRVFTTCQRHIPQQVKFICVKQVGSIYHCLDSNQTTNFSTSSANSTRGDSRVQKFRKVVDTFVAGSKQLGKDVKLMFDIQKKLKNSNYNWDGLKTEEIIHLHQVIKEITSTDFWSLKDKVMRTGKHNQRPQINLQKIFTTLKKCSVKFECLIYEVLLTDS